MKNKYIAIYALMLLSVIVTGVFIAFMPSEVPMHYNIAGEIDRIGSKYENLIFPLLTILIGCFFLIIINQLKKKNLRGVESAVLWSGIACLIFINILFGYFLWKATSYVPELNESIITNGIYRTSTIGLGLIFIILGFVMPKTQINGYVGLRTTWSMKNERVWKKSQRFGGITFIICGFVSIIAGIFINGIASIFTLMTVLMISTIVCVVASYKIYKKDTSDYS